MNSTQLKIFIGMSRTLNKINNATNKIYNKYGLTSGQFAVLEALYHKGDLSVGEVQERILSTSGTIPVIVKNLEKRSLLEKKQDSQDKRRYILHITDKGRDLLDKVYPENKKIIVSMINVWDEKEQEEILNHFLKFKEDSDEEKSQR